MAQTFFDIPATDLSFDAVSARVLLTIDRTAGVTNHNGGWIGFGPDGFLYIASGDSPTS